MREARGFLSQELDELKQRDPLSLTYIRSLPTFAEKRQAVFVRPDRIPLSLSPLIL